MNRLRLALAAPLVFVPALLLAALDPTVGTPPTAKKVEHKVVLHGDTRLDDYFWL
jgi:hypothetical protein